MNSSINGDRFGFGASPNFHARSITTNHGWKVSLDRDLDIFQWFESSALNAATNLQEARLTKGYKVSFIRVDEA
ncbi:MIT C-terminal domain-containing protein [Parasynechococcus sp.]|uniref:MIT C-terminal domain-containing protein n=1 Tax=Parasynechococcus sp. TaxID=3101203 RepID=UPI003703FFB0